MEQLAQGLASQASTGISSHPRSSSSRKAKGSLARVSIRALQASASWQKHPINKLADAREGSAEQHHCWLRPLALCQPPTSQPALDALFVEPGHTHHSLQSIKSSASPVLHCPLEEPAPDSQKTDMRSIVRCQSVPGSQLPIPVGLSAEG